MHSIEDHVPPVGVREPSVAQHSTSHFNKHAIHSLGDSVLLWCVHVCHFMMNALQLKVVL